MVADLIMNKFMITLVMVLTLSSVPHKSSAFIMGISTIYVVAHSSGNVILTSAGSGYLAGTLSSSIPVSAGIITSIIGAPAFTIIAIVTGVATLAVGAYYAIKVFWPLPKCKTLWEHIKARLTVLINRFGWEIKQECQYKVGRFI